MPLPIVASNASTVTKAVDVFDVVVFNRQPSDKRVPHHDHFDISKESRN